MSPPADRSSRLYTDLAADYDRMYGEKAYASEVAFVRERYAETVGGTPDRALIVGCGTGGHAEYLAAADIDVLGIDPNPAMLAIARRKLPELRFQSDRLPALSLAGEQPFDLIWLPFTVLNYLAPNDLDAAIGTLRYHLADRGLLVVDNGHFPTDRDIEFDLIDGREGGCCRFFGFERVDDYRIRMALLFVLPPNRFVADAHTLTAFADTRVRATLEAAGLAVERYGWYVDEPPTVSGPSVFVGAR
ncbi:MAG: class I SAM-dependent methyltransferase [Halobacteriales archaeon]